MQLIGRYNDKSLSRSRDELAVSRRIGSVPLIRRFMTSHCRSRDESALCQNPARGEIAPLHLSVQSCARIQLAAKSLHCICQFSPSADVMSACDTLTGSPLIIGSTSAPCGASSLARPQLLAAQANWLVRVTQVHMRQHLTILKFPPAWWEGTWS